MKMTHRKTKATTAEPWQVESDMRTLLEAEAIRSDPKRFKAAANLAKKKSEEMESVFETEPGDDD